MKKTLLSLLLFTFFAQAEALPTAPIVINFAPVTPHCGADTIALAASASGGVGGPYTYLWMPGGSTSSFMFVTVTTTTTFTLTVSDAAHDTTVSTITQVINAIPDVHFSQGNTSICAGNCISFTDSSSIAFGSIASEYWLFSDDVNDTAFVHQPLHCYSTAGVYSVKLTETSAAGCVSSLNKNNLVHVHPKPDADFTVSIWLPYTVNITNSSSGGTSWHWSFGNGDTSLLQNPPSVTYTNPNDYTITLIVENTYGCRDTATQDELLTDVPLLAKAEKSVIIGPNPFSAATLITFSEEQKNTILYVRDELGNVVQQSAVNGTEYCLSMANLAKGIYYVEVVNGKKEIINKKVVLK